MLAQIEAFSQKYPNGPVLPKYPALRGVDHIMITVVVKATVLRNLAGRDDYISNEERQENLVYVHESVDDPTMKYTFDDVIKLQLEHIEKQNKYLTKNHKDVVRCQGHEFMFILDNELSKMDPKYLGEIISNIMKEKLGTPAVKLAFHWNKTKKSYHVHVIVPEYNFEPKIKYGSIETRNRYYNEEGKQSTKKECVDENGILKPGCTFVKKGNRLERFNYFETHTNEKIKSKKSLVELKKWLADYMNEQLQEEKYRWDKDPLHLRQQSKGVNTYPETKILIDENNYLIQQYNYLTDTIREIDNSEEKLEELSVQKLELQQVAVEEGRDNYWYTLIQEFIEQMLKYIEELEKGFIEFFDDLFGRRTNLDDKFNEILNNDDYDYEETNSLDHVIRNLNKEQER